MIMYRSTFFLKNTSALGLSAAEKAMFTEGYL